ncbi:hypothetical protein [Phycicoccus sp. Root101]|uniref:hypothetical protein n=1 Tax=Phycicoccus sp. Root101 TaxID=1736421 RepID=UPI0012F89FCA|nr:hypothetical protein [Phycicoccus sp. Root101]
MTRRPLLRTVWPALRRGPGQVQFGTAAEHAVVVGGLTEPEVVSLEELDGTRDLPVALTSGTGATLLEELVACGLVVEAAPASTVPPVVRAVLAPDADALVRTSCPPAAGYAALSARRAAHVVVAGRGDLPAALTAALRRAGIGRVSHGPRSADDWEHVALRERPPVPRPDVVVLPASGALEPAAAHSWRRRGTPVLPVLMHDVEAVVGPLVVAGGPCLRCLDLTRADLDPAWPALLGQLTRPGVGAGHDVGGETTLVGMAAGMAAMVVLGVVDGQPLPAGRSLEVGLPWPRVRQREWAVHPRCSCAVQVTYDPPADANPARQVRMAG